MHQNRRRGETWKLWGSNEHCQSALRPGRCTPPRIHILHGELVVYAASDS